MMEMMRRKGVVIGGTGLIGGTIVNFFKTKHAGEFDIRAPSSKKLSLRVESDIHKYVNEIRPDFIINAAVAGLAASSLRCFETNYLGAINLARAAQARNIPYIHLSSAAVLPNGEDLHEDNTLPLTANLSNYAKSKLMAEISLQHMAMENGLDYSCLRLAIVYGAHDHKIQGFHRMLFSVADQSMPFLFTRKGICHSYTNSRKIPYFILHMLENRKEFSGKIYHFIDKEPVELAHLILALRKSLNVSSPKKIYIPYPLANSCRKVLTVFLKVLRHAGINGTLPPELMFLTNFYKIQTLNADRLLSSSFVDPLANETIFTRLPELIEYYMTRWNHENKLGCVCPKFNANDRITKLFDEDPQALIDEIQQKKRPLGWLE